MNTKFKMILNCTSCEQPQELEVFQKDYVTYRQPNRPHVQSIFPYLNASERELLISGTCKACWDKMFGSEDENEEDDE